MGARIGRLPFPENIITLSKEEYKDLNRKDVPLLTGKETDRLEKLKKEMHKRIRGREDGES
jgi:hypothetical protein